MSVPAPSLRSLSPQAEARYTNTQRTIHSKFDAGMIRDIASWELPTGAMYDAADCLCDFAGKVRKRGGTTSPAAGNSTATVENLMSYRSNGIDQLTNVYGTLGKAGVSIQSFNRGTGATTQIFTDGSVDTIACRPFQYGNFMVAAFQATGITANDRNQVYFVGGGTAASFDPTAATVTAASNVISGVAPTSFAAGHVGAIIALSDAGANYYIGRIVTVTSTSSVRVEPRPTVGFTATKGIVTPCYAYSDLSPLGGVGFIYSYLTQTGRYGCAYQGRIVFGYTLQTSAIAPYTLGIEAKPNRVIWSGLPTEAPRWVPTIGGVVTPIPGGLDGEQTLNPFTFGDFNFVDIPGLEGMTGLAPAGEGQLIVFGPRKAYRISGFLATETVANPSFSFSVDQISENVGISAPIIGVTGDRPDRSIQYTPEGLIFAGNNGIYVYDGSQMRPLLQGKNARYFQDRRRAGNAIHGSFYSLTKNHYYLSMSGSDGGLMINLDTLAMTRFTNVDIFDAVPEPQDATKLWGARWWDTTGAAPTMTKGQLIGLESIWLPTSANKTDADGTAVIMDVQTAAYVDGELGANKLLVGVMPTYKLAGSGSPTATLKADSKLDVADATYATIDASVPAATTTTTKNYDEVGQLMTEGQGVEFRFTTNVSCDSCEIAAFDVGIHHGPPGFST